MVASYVRKRRFFEVAWSYRFGAAVDFTDARYRDQNLPCITPVQSGSVAADIPYFDRHALWDARDRLAELELIT